MGRTGGATRRRMLRTTGLAAVAVTAAGCTGGATDVPGIEIDPGTGILLEAHHEHWIGVEPAVIEDEQNPTLALEAGEDYEMGWVQGDGGLHNLEIWDENEELVDTHATNLTISPGEDGDWLEFTVSDEMAYYRCNPHRLMQGEINVA